MENAFNERGVMVTRNGLSAAGQIFALREIRGVEVRTVRKNKLVPCAISQTGAAAANPGGARGAPPRTLGHRLFARRPLRRPSPKRPDTA